MIRIARRIPVLPQNTQWVNSNDTNVVGATSTLQTNYLFSPTFVRVLLNSGSRFDFGNLRTSQRSE